MRSGGTVSAYQNLAYRMNPDCTYCMNLTYSVERTRAWRTGRAWPPPEGPCPRACVAWGGRRRLAGSRAAGHSPYTCTWYSSHNRTTTRHTAPRWLAAGYSYMRKSLVRGILGNPVDNIKMLNLRPIPLQKAINNAGHAGHAGHGIELWVHGLRDMCTSYVQ